MRRKVSLYIGDQLADLDDDSFVLVNYSREDLTDPQAVLNSYTQTVKLPATGNNAEILGHYYRLDRRTTGSGGTGPNFAALKRTPFVIYDDTACVVLRGYLKLEEATHDAYTVTLYGGLGQFFYDLTYDGNGNKRTLAGCSYQWTGTWYPSSEIYIRCARSAVINAWGALRYGAPASGQPFDIINFVPALNGTTYPFKFDTNKAIYHKGATAATQIPNLYTSATVDGRDYGSLADSGTILCQFGNKHNEWEVQDLRSYCQRPAISLRKMMEGIQRLASDLGYTLNYDSAWWTDDNTYLARVWMTLPFVDRDTLSDVDLQMMTAADFLAGTLSPAEYLVAIAKTFGFVFLPSVDGTSIQMLLRDTFYTSGTDVDLTDRIDTSTIEVRPYDIAARYYDWQTEMAGIFCANYELKYGRRYGSLRLDTGYDFDKSAKVVTGSLPWKGCADVVDLSDNYQVIVGSADPDYGTATNYLCKFAFTDSVKWSLYYGGENDDQQTRSFEPTPMDNYGGMNYVFRAGNAGKMWLPLPQLHDADGKAYDKGGVLLFFEGQSMTPVVMAGGLEITAAVFAVSDDNADMLTLNGGVPCWDISPVGAGTYRTITAWVPSFRRWHFNNGALDMTLDWGDPLEVPAGTGTFAADKGLYEYYWAFYMGDRFDQDTAVMRAKVLLDGMQVSEALLRHFYYYGGSWWALNKIINHSLTTLGPTECEFVRVQARNHYNAGQATFEE